MNVECPHQQKVFARTKGQILFYLHEDGTSCFLMNDLSIQALDIFEVFSRNVKPELTKEMRLCFLMSEAYRLDTIYPLLSTLRSSKLREYLVFLLDGLKIFEANRAILGEMYQIFGDVFIQNIELIDEISYRGIATQNMTYKKLQMADIKSDKLNDFFTDFEKEKNERAKKQSDILQNLRKQ
jgi:hypothetical protein